MIQPGSCPRCQARMAAPSPSTRSCQRCGGFWITLEAAGRRMGDASLADMVGESADSFAVSGQRRCPCCHVPMREIGFRGLDIDVCGTCDAVFLDPGELRLLAQASGYATDEPASSDGPRPLLDTARADRVEGAFVDVFGDFLFGLVRWL